MGKNRVEGWTEDAGLRDAGAENDGGGSDQASATKITCLALASSYM